MKKNNYSKLFISIFFLFMFITGIYAADELPPGSNIGGGVTSKFVGCGDGSVFCWNTEAINGQGRVQAIRVTLVDDKGVILPGTKSYDYFKCDGVYESITNSVLDRTNVNFYRSKRHKNLLLTEGENTSEDWAAQANVAYRSLGDAMCMKNNPIPKFNGATSNVLRPYFLRVASKKDRMFEDFFIPTFFEKMGYNYPEELKKLKTDPDHFKKQALLIEPIVFFRLTSKRGGNLNWTREYIGTVTEVARMLNSSASKDPGYTGNDVYFDLIQKNKKVGGQWVPAKYRGIHFNNPTAFNLDFPLAIYINDTGPKAGLVGIKHWVESNYSDNYASEILTRNGVAAGHVWLNEILCPAPDKITNDDLPTCCNELIDANKINNQNYTKCCKELYDKGKLTRSHLPACCFVLKTSDSLYRSYCDNQKINDSCKWKLDISCPDNCDNKTKGEVKDMDDWDCIFKSRSATIPNVRTHFYEWSNQYCDMFCREEVDYQFPQGGITVLAGHHFTVGFERSNSWSPIRFKGLSECRTTSDIGKIKFEQFQRDYDAIDRTLPGLWERYQLELARDKSRNSARQASSKNCDYYCDYNVRGITCCRDADRDWDDCKTGSPNACRGDYVNGKWNRCAYRVNTCKGGWGPWYCIDHDEPYDHGYWMTPPPAYHGVFGPVTESGWCTTNGSGREPRKPSSGSASAYSRYISAKNRRDELLRQIKKCNDWKRDYSHFSPNVFLTYEEDIYRLTGIELNKKIHDDIYTDFYVGSSYSRNYYRRELRTTSHVCTDGTRCRADQIKYPANDSIRQYYHREINYELPNNIYRYVSKPPGYSSNYRPPLQYIDVGYSNLPVHYSRLENRYDISLEYKTFGRNHKFNKYVFDGVSFTGNYRDSVKCNTLYDCNYRVRNDFMYCNHRNCKDLRVVFRPISLSNPFPGENGGGRAPGENWRWDVSKITRNRNLSNPERIYFDREPMYQITLDAKTILAIRGYNRNASGGYSDFNLRCVVGEGTECKSNFIRNTFINNFNTRLCGMSNDWNKCKSLDR